MGTMQGSVPQIHHHFYASIAVRNTELSFHFQIKFTMGHNSISFLENLLHLDLVLIYLIVKLKY